MPPSEIPATFAARLHALRVERGLTQGEAGGDKMSASYVSLLEAGKRPPTRDVLEALASTLKTTVNYLMHGEPPEAARELELAISYADLALHNGEGPDALAKIDAALAEAASSPITPAWLLRAHQVRARALETVGDLEAAAAAFEDVLAMTAEAKEWEDHLQAAIDLTRVYQQAGDVEQSITVAEAALARVTEFELTGTDVHARLASTLVGSYYLRGDLTKAGQVASSALAAVEPNAGDAARAAIMWNASIVAHRRGDTEGALGLAEQAVALYSEHKDRGSLARLQVMYAWLLLRTTPPQPAEARKLLRRAHKALTNEGTAIDLASCETELAVAALLLGQTDEALELVDTAYDRYGGIVTLDSAGTQLIRGRILLAARRKAQAEKQYREAAESLGQMAVSRVAAAAWRELADAYTQLGLFEDAAMAYQQALTEVGVRAEPGALPAPPRDRVAAEANGAGDRHRR